MKPSSVCMPIRVSALSTPSGIASYALSDPKLKSTWRWYSLDLSPRRLIQRESNSEATYSMIRQWLVGCLRNHDGCKVEEGLDTLFVPNRLLHVASGSTIRLSIDHPPSTQYLALSYCWGTPRIFSTTRENLEDHLRSISWSMLPKTFQHAIEITRAIGYEYIWIDSLCIIQQDAEDFTEQSGQMGDIYANASAVISADSALNVHEGIHQRRKRATIIIPIHNWTKRPDGRAEANHARDISLESCKGGYKYSHGELKTIYSDWGSGVEFPYGLQIHMWSSSRSPIRVRAWVRIFLQQLPI
jgi:hypothetical protein